MRELASPSTRSFTDPLARWALSRIRLDDRPFSFDGHEYLRAIYDDTSRHVVLSKAAQIGGTTWAVLRSLHACLLGLNVIYFFPTRTDVLEFSKSRVSPLLGLKLFTEYLLPFELTSLVLLAAIVGAVVLALRKGEEKGVEGAP